ncbi:PalH/RIM21-domain-containing protein [Lipomyces tetrasporus]
MIVDMWRNPTTTSSHTPLCTPYTLPAGVVILASTTQTISPTAVFSPLCTSSSSALSYSSTSTLTLKNPFYSSIIPIAYTISGTTVLAWVLLLLLLVTPQRRPYLQKLATLSVALSLTIALSECSKILKKQYDEAYEDAEELRSYIDDGLTLKIFRAVSDVFLWLAQVQTLIRLFPRHREKKIIKWLGLALIVVDTVFWSLQSFLPIKEGDDRSFKDAIPALAYLFQIILSLLYSAYVVYYSISKRMYAYHIKNLILALLSLLAVLTPIIFFLLDISRQWISGWGDFVRWVGAAAASVVVWEWVERIEYLESKVQETGVLGRQVFEEEMLETGTSRGARASRDVARARRRPDGGGGAAGTVDRRRHPRRRRDDDNDRTGGGDDGGMPPASTVSSDGMRMGRGRSACDSEPAEDSSGLDNEVDSDDARGAVGEDSSFPRTKEGSRGIADRLRARRRRRRQGNNHDDTNNEALNASRPGIGNSIMGFLDNGRAMLFGRPLSRATTGTSVTSYRVNASSIMEDGNGSASGEEVRVRHFYPLKRGLSRSSHSSSPTSFTNAAESGSVSLQMHSRNAPTPSQSPEATLANAGSAATGIHRNSPAPSVTFREDVRRTPSSVAGCAPPVAPSSANSSPLPSVSEDRRDACGTSHSVHAVSSTRRSLDGHQENGHSADDDCDDDDDYGDDDGDSDYVVYGEAANSEMVLRNSQSIHVQAQQHSSPVPHAYGPQTDIQPPAFERLPGFNDGDYWDEKDPRYHLTYANMQQGAASTVADSRRQLPQNGAPRPPSNWSRAYGYPRHSNSNASFKPSRATLEPTDPRTSRRIVERFTGARDWVVTVHDDDGRDESR